jgi:hypothetical protein
MTSVHADPVLPVATVEDRSSTGLAGLRILAFVRNHPRTVAALSLTSLGATGGAWFGLPKLADSSSWAGTMQNPRMPITGPVVTRQNAFGRHYGHAPGRSSPVSSHSDQSSSDTLPTTEFRSDPYITGPKEQACPRFGLLSEIGPVAMSKKIFETITGQPWPSQLDVVITDKVRVAAGYHNPLTGNLVVSRESSFSTTWERDWELVGLILHEAGHGVVPYLEERINNGILGPTEFLSHDTRVVEESFAQLFRIAGAHLSPNPRIRFALEHHPSGRLMALAEGNRDYGFAEGTANAYAALELSDGDCARAYQLLRQAFVEGLVDEETRLATLQTLHEKTSELLAIVRFANLQEQASDTQISNTEIPNAGIPNSGSSTQDESAQTSEARPGG